MTSNKAETPQSEDTTQSKESLTKNYGTAAAYAEEALPPGFDFFPVIQSSFFFGSVTLNFVF